MIEKSLVLLKPDAYLRKYIGASILKEFKLRNDFKILAFKEIQASSELAGKHYFVHKNKPFYSLLIEYLTLGPVIALIIEGEGVIGKIRTMLGATFSNNAELSTIRGKYGIWAGINCVHASDAISTAETEIKLWKSEASLKELDSKKVKEKIESYINKWIKKEVNRTRDLRNICESLVKNEENYKKDGKDKIFKLLEEECVNSNKNQIKKFVKVILDNLV